VAATGLDPGKVGEFNSFVVRHLRAADELHSCVSEEVFPPTTIPKKNPVRRNAR
jgi:hypothetical protein